MMMMMMVMVVVLIVVVAMMMVAAHPKSAYVLHVAYVNIHTAGLRRAPLPGVLGGGSSCFRLGQGVPFFPSSASPLVCLEKEGGGEKGERGDRALNLAVDDMARSS